MNLISESSSNLKCFAFELQDEIVPHLEPGRLPSTVDPDIVRPDKGKRASHRPVKISAWKLAKLDSHEAIKAGAKARASSSVLRPVSSRPHPYDGDHFSSTTMSSPTSTRPGSYYETNARTRLSPTKSSYPPSRASRDDTDTCASSPPAANLTPSPVVPHSSSFNPIYQSSLAVQSPMGPAGDDAAQVPSRRDSTGPAETGRSSVFWDPEAGRFVSSASRSIGSSSAATELTYSGQSIFFGGPVVNEQRSRSGRSSVGPQRGSTSSYYQQGRSQRGGQLPVFVPSDSQQQNQFSSNLE